jgi:hypothetical protein
MIFDCARDSGRPVHCLPTTPLPINLLLDVFILVAYREAQQDKPTACQYY